MQRARGLQSQQLENSSNTEQLINSAASRGVSGGAGDGGEKNVKRVQKKAKACGRIHRLIALMDCADL